MRYGLHTDGRKCGPIDPERVNDTGWTWYDTEAERNAAVPPPPWPQLIAATRYAHEIGGTTFTHSDGNTYGADTRREQRGTITDLKDEAKEAKAETSDRNWPLPWLTPQGWIDLSPDDALAMHEAVQDHVEACFRRQRELDGMVTDGTITESDLETGWP